jgi:tRNA-dihydrouridine synthase
LRVGPIEVDPPVVLAPMAGITNAAFRQLCREQGAGLYVCEMITSRGLVERDRKTLSMLQFDPGERVRSVQLYGVDPAIMAQATDILCNEYGVAHVDLNFGCPVPKVTRKVAARRTIQTPGSMIRSLVDAAACQYHHDQNSDRHQPLS